MDRRKLNINKLCNGLGLRVESLVQSKKHFHAVLTNGIRSKTIIFPVSASDHRWELNKKSEIRKAFSPDPQ